MYYLPLLIWVSHYRRNKRNSIQYVFTGLFTWFFWASAVAREESRKLCNSLNELNSLGFSDLERKENKGKRKESKFGFTQLMKYRMSSEFIHLMKKSKLIFGNQEII